MPGRGAADVLRQDAMLELNVGSRLPKTTILPHVDHVPSPGGRHKMCHVLWVPQHTLKLWSTDGFSHWCYHCTHLRVCGRFDLRGHFYNVK